MKRKSESKLVSDCRIWFHNNYCLKNSIPKLAWILLPNEVAMKVRGLLLQCNVSSKIISQVVGFISQDMQSLGLHPGASDVIIAMPNGVTLWCEFKLPTNNQQPNQIEFEETVTKLGHTYVVIKSLDQFKDVIIQELSKNEA